MHFTPALAATILAVASTALAAPYDAGNSTVTATGTGTATQPSSTTSSTTTKATTAPSGLAGLSKTQRIFLSDTRVDALNNVLTSNEDFKFNFEEEKQKNGGPSKGGKVVPANRKTFPALTNTGIGGAVAFLGPCGFNTPHVHPRATEFAMVVEGTIVSSMIPENNVVDKDDKPREILNKLSKFESTVFYAGSVHSQFNPNCEPATFFAAFNSEDAGTGQIAQELFAASNADATAAVFGNMIDGADIDKLKNSISKNVALGVEQCLQKCGISKRK
ncbi:hypothetical protein JX265_012118 [Neoarthrinium moseri]|uniref:Cupin type-1 domain-containing protein n=1 Tax=Neoarthrinium moseri TaxID=1658444 RepID=A0A9P9WB56_9PEZI|nr:uncharacterized protein JN550_001328 [Neoarthrinium moseri]KAI1849321.1 hypothetical protein JX266_004816 [Neoarthrinium moseri]KAI1855855.1 hypothetical protein JX265_012118 [Neoarthrinium moseri]KAI1877256.1 hypothetical protein JN550_001328 [Neoarthrinium moseri]